MATCTVSTFHQCTNPITIKVKCPENVLLKAKSLRVSPAFHKLTNRMLGWGMGVGQLERVLFVRLQKIMDLP